MGTITDLLTKSATSIVSNSLSTAENNFKNKVNSTPLGQVLGKLGVPIFQGTSGPGLATNSWLGRASARPDPLINIDWEIDMPDGLDSSYIEEVQASMSDIGISEGVFRAGQRQYYAGVEDIGALSLTMYEDRLLTSTRYLNDWKSKIRNPNGTRNYPSEYKRIIKVYPKDGAGLTLGEFKYVGCWPTKIPAITFASASVARVTHQVEFSVDAVEITLYTNSSVKFGSIMDFVQGFPVRIANTLSNAARGVANNALKSAAGKLFG